MVQHGSERFIPCQLSWLADPHEAATEIYRNAERGLQSGELLRKPRRAGFPNIYDKSWDPFFAACEETETVVNLHVGSSGTTRPVCSSSHPLVTTALFPVSGIEALIDWVISGTLLRHPRLTVALSEPAVVGPDGTRAARRAQRQSESVGRRSVDRPPGAPNFMEVAHRNFVFTSIEVTRPSINST